MRVKKKKKKRKEIQTIYFTSFHAECKYVDCGKSAWVYPCFHSRTQSTSAEGAVGAPLGTPTAPTERQRQLIPQSSEHFFLHGRAILTSRFTEWHKWYLKFSLTPPDSPSCQTTLPTHSPPPQFVLIYLFRHVFEVEAFYLLEFSPPPLYAYPDMNENLK